MKVGDLVIYHESHNPVNNQPPAMGVVTECCPGPYYTVYFTKYHWRPEKTGVVITYIAETELEVVSENR